MLIEWMAPWWALPVYGFAVYAFARFVAAYAISRCGRDDDPSEHDRA